MTSTTGRTFTTSTTTSGYHTSLWTYSYIAVALTLDEFIVQEFQTSSSWLFEFELELSVTHLKSSPRVPQLDGEWPIESPELELKSQLDNFQNFKSCPRVLVTRHRVTGIWRPVHSRVTDNSNSKTQLDDYEPSSCRGCAVVVCWSLSVGYNWMMQPITSYYSRCKMVIQDHAHGLVPTWPCITILHTTYYSRIAASVSVLLLPRRSLSIQHSVGVIGIDLSLIPSVGLCVCVSGGLSVCPESVLWQTGWLDLYAIWGGDGVSRGCYSMATFLQKITKFGWCALKF